MSSPTLPNLAPSPMADGVTRTKEKWGSAAASAGFSIIPNHLLAVNRYLPEWRHVSPTEMVVLLNILAAWWAPDRLPFPSKATLGRRAGLSTRQVQRALTSLENKGHLKRVARYQQNNTRASNIYDVRPIVETVRDAANAHPKDFKRGAESIAPENETPVG